MEDKNEAETQEAGIGLLFGTPFRARNPQWLLLIVVEVGGVAGPTAFGEEGRLDLENRGQFKFEGRITNRGNGASVFYLCCI
jgi:hypothetical protein